MTPEELAEIREGYWGRPGSDQESKIRLLFDHIDDQAVQIEALKEKLISDRANKKISMFCNCERCWPWGTPKSEGRIAAEETARQEARQQLAEDPKLKAAGVTWE